MDYVTDTTENWSLTSLGKQKIDVYDLGVQDNENFFANDILVHNSNYLNLQDLVERKFGKDYKKKGINNIEITEWLVEFIEGNNGDGLVQKFLNSSYVELQEYMNCPQQKMHMALEKVASNSLFKNNKKRYAMSVMYSEGTWYRDRPKLNVTGLESVSSKTPAFARKFLKEVYDHILNSDNNRELGKILNKQLEEFKQMSLDEIAEVVSINKGIEKINSISLLEKHDLFNNEQDFEKGLTHTLKAAYVHNAYNFQMKYHIKPIETNGVKIKMLPLMKRNSVSSIHNVIAYIGTYPEEWESIKHEIDKDLIWNKRYLSTVDKFTHALDYPYKLVDMDFDLF